MASVGGKARSLQACEAMDRIQKEYVTIKTWGDADSVLLLIKKAQTVCLLLAWGSERCSGSSRPERWCLMLLVSTAAQHNNQSINTQKKRRL